MPRFPVPFGRRKSTAENPENGAIATPSFRVLERNDFSSQKPFDKSFDGGVRLTGRPYTLSRANPAGLSAEDNIFADLKANRYAY